MEKKEREKLKERFMNLVVDDKREKITVKDLTATAMMIRNSPPDYSVLLNFIEKELDKARVRGELEALEDLKDYIFINDNFRNSDTQPGWDDFRRYAKEMERIYKEELSELKSK